MSYSFAIIEEATGIVIRTGAVSQPDNMDIQARAGELAVALDRNDVLPNGLWQYAGGEFNETAPPAPSFEVLQIEAYLVLDSIASAKLDLWQGGGAPTGGLQVDDTSMGRISMWVPQAMAAKTDGSPFALEYWIMADNSHLAIADADAFLALASAATTYRSAAILRNSELKQAIANAADAAALAAIDLSFGWPE